MSHPTTRTLTSAWQMATAAADQLGLTLVVDISLVGLQTLAGAEGLLTVTTGNQDIRVFRLFVFVELGLCVERGQTFIAGYCLLLRMNNQGMFSELTVSSEGLLTISTLERSLVQMHHEVVL